MSRAGAELDVAALGHRGRRILLHVVLGHQAHAVGTEPRGTIAVGYDALRPAGVVCPLADDVAEAVVVHRHHRAARQTSRGVLADVVLAAADEDRRLIVTRQVLVVGGGQRAVVGRRRVGDRVAVRRLLREHEVRRRPVGDEDPLLLLQMQEVVVGLHLVDGLGRCTALSDHRRVGERPGVRRRHQRVGAGHARHEERVAGIPGVVPIVLDRAVLVLRRQEVALR